MNKTTKILIGFLIFDAVVVAGYFASRSLSGPSQEPAVWKTIDQAYVPEDEVEAYIKDDAVAKELLPVQVKNYGRNRKALPALFLVFPDEKASSGTPHLPGLSPGGEAPRGLGQPNGRG